MLSVFTRCDAILFVKDIINQIHFKSIPGSSNSRGRKRRVNDTPTQSTDDDDSCAGYETDISDYLIKPLAKKQRYFAYSSSESSDSSNSDDNNESKGIKRKYDGIESDDTDFQETKNALEVAHKKRRFQ